MEKDVPQTVKLKTDSNVKELDRAFVSLFVETEFTSPTLNLAMTETRIWTMDVTFYVKLRKDSNVKGLPPYARQFVGTDSL